MKNKRRAAALIWAAVLIVLLAAAWLIFGRRETGGDTQQEEPAASQTEAAAEPEEEPCHSYAVVDKSETVYIDADASGAPQEITVETLLKNPGGSEPIRDFSLLTDIKNTKGEEEYAEEGDGVLLWDNLGEDISYKGTSSEELPVSVNIRYFLEETEVTPEELAGESGHVRIRFDYENRTAVQESVGGQELTVPVPFMAVTAMFLPSDVFYNVEVTNGKLVTMDEQSMVVGYALPGLTDCLKLSEYEPTEEIEIPEYVEITADVSDFELSFTATVFTAGLLEDMETEDLDDIDELIDDMKEFSDASTELVDGVAELSDGVGELSDGVEEYTDGVRSVDEAIAEVLEALDLLNENKTALREGASAIQSGLEGLDAALSQVTLPESGSDTSGDSENDTSFDAAASMQALSEDLTSLLASLETLKASYGDTEPPQELSAMEEAVADIQTQLGALGSWTDSLSAQSESLSTLSSLADTLGSFQQTVHQLAEVSAQLTEGVQNYTHGVSELYRGTRKLSEGSTELADASTELTDAMTELTDGVQELSDGVQEFDEEGVKELTDLAGDDLAAIVRRIRALKAADDGYINYGGILDGQTGEVRFIFETEEIEAGD